MSNTDAPFGWDSWAPVARYSVVAGLFLSLGAGLMGAGWHVWRPAVPDPHGQNSYDPCRAAT